MDAAQARAIYEEIVRRKRDPALIELAGHGLLRARVFPIGAGETRKITLRYTQMLDRVGDAWRFRYTAGTGAGAAASSSFRMQVDSAARFGDPYSPTHRLSTSRSDDRILLTFADSNTRGDLELFLPLTRNLVGMSLVTSQPVGEDGFFMLLLAPGRTETPSLRRDLVEIGRASVGKECRCRWSPDHKKKTRKKTIRIHRGRELLHTRTNERYK